MPERDFEKAVHEARAELQSAELSVQADRRLRARLFGGAPAVRSVRALRPRLAMASAFLLLVAVGVGGLLARRGGQSAAGFETVSASADYVQVVRAGGLHIERGHAVLREAERGLTLAVQAPAVLVREPDALRVGRGRVELTVRKRSREHGALRVRVSGGSIEVFGTRFTVIELGDHGEVSLHEGSIGFRPVGGGLVMLEPGKTLAWPLTVEAKAPERSVEPEPAPAPAGPAPSTPSYLSRREETVQTDALLRDVASLRTRARFEDAAKLLKRGLTWRLRPASRELLSYELGAILTWQLRDRAKACAHWREHLRGHPTGRFEEEIAGAKNALRCTP